jgi:hypothetical protein
MLTAEKRNEFQELSKPLIKWLNDNTDPHAVIIIEPDMARLFSGEIGFPTQEYIRY